MELNGSTVGLAFLMTMCNIPLSLGLTQDGGTSLARVTAIATHEVGHNFNMRHDDGMYEVKCNIISYLSWCVCVSVCVCVCVCVWHCGEII